MQQLSHYTTEKLELAGIVTVDFRSIFHAEYDAVGRFSFLLLIFE